MNIFSEVHTIREQSRAWKRQGLRVGFVPTMGYLHEGHLSLIECALQHSDRVIVSIFVNPTQFAPDEDLDRYPRDHEGDIKKITDAGAAACFLPPVEALYPEGAQTFVEVKELTRALCGVERPTHFRGVATVVAKLFHIVLPDVAVFGKKDYQQLVTIQRMVRDLLMEVEVIGAPIVREEDGLAMSSRNVYLSDVQREDARALNQALKLGRQAFASGERSPAGLLDVVRGHLSGREHLRPGYVELRDSFALHTAQEPLDGTERMFVSAYLGQTRLIDNAPLSGECSLPES